MITFRPPEAGGGKLTCGMPLSHWYIKQILCIKKHCIDRNNLYPITKSCYPVSPLPVLNPATRRIAYIKKFTGGSMKIRKLSIAFILTLAGALCACATQPIDAKYFTDKSNAPGIDASAYVFCSNSIKLQALNFQKLFGTSIEYQYRKADANWETSLFSRAYRFGARLNANGQKEIKVWKLEPGRYKIINIGAAGFAGHRDIKLDARPGTVFYFGHMDMLEDTALFRSNVLKTGASDDFENDVALVKQQYPALTQLKFVNGAPIPRERATSNKK